MLFPTESNQLEQFDQSEQCDHKQLGQSEQLDQPEQLNQKQLDKPQVQSQTRLEPATEHSQRIIEQTPEQTASEIYSQRLGELKDKQKLQQALVQQNANQALLQATNALQQASTALLEVSKALQQTTDAKLESLSSHEPGAAIGKVTAPVTAPKDSDPNLSSASSQAAQVAKDIQAAQDIQAPNDPQACETAQAPASDTLVKCGISRADLERREQEAVEESASVRFDDGMFAHGNFTKIATETIQVSPTKEPLSQRLTNLLKGASRNQGPRQPLTTEEYGRITRRTIIAAICVAVSLIVTKLAVTIASNSISLFASLMDSMFDILSSVANFVILRQALKPADKDHEFGHGKFEYIGVFGQAVFIGTLAIGLIVNTISRFRSPVAIEYALPSLIVLLITIVVTFVLVRYQQKQIERTGSDVLKADQAHYTFDLLMNSAVALAILAALWGWYFVDALLALVIAIYMIKTVYDMLKICYAGFTDAAISAEDQRIVYEIIALHPQVIACHDLKTRQAAHTRYIQCHLELANSLSLQEAHDIMDEIETAILSFFPNASLHLHPEPTAVASAERAGTYIAKENQALISELKAKLETTSEGN